MYNNYTKIELLRWPAGWSVDGGGAAAAQPARVTNQAIDDAPPSS